MTLHTLHALHGSAISKGVFNLLDHNRTGVVTHAQIQVRVCGTSLHSCTAYVHTWVLYVAGLLLLFCYY